MYYFITGDFHGNIYRTQYVFGIGVNRQKIAVNDGTYAINPRKDAETAGTDKSANLRPTVVRDTPTVLACGPRTDTAGKLSCLEAVKGNCKSDNICLNIFEISTPMSRNMKN